MPYLPVWKQVKTLLRFLIGEYYKDIERVLNEREMALAAVVIMWHVINILYYTVMFVIWGIGRVFKYL